jgi:hypothetical protein
VILLDFWPCWSKLPPISFLTLALPSFSTSFNIVAPLAFLTEEGNSHPTSKHPRRGISSRTLIGGPL